jgi:ribosome-dependent ATPase
MTQAFSLYTELTVRQNLVLHARLFDFSEGDGRRRVEELLTDFGLEHVADTLAESLPLGIRQRLSLAVAVLHEPEVLILDEPTSGVDPVARDGFWELLIRLSREKGVTIFLSTHFMNEAARCDRMSMMHQGKVLAQGPPAELVAQRGASSLEEAFIGYLEEASGKAAPEATLSQPAAVEMPVAQSEEPRRGFSPSRVWAFARREAIRTAPRFGSSWHSPFLGPLLLMVVFGYGHIAGRRSFDLFPCSTSTVTQASRTYSDSFRGSIYYDEQDPITDYSELDRRLRNGELRFALEIPPGFQKGLANAAAARRSRPISMPPFLSGPRPRAVMSRPHRKNTKPPYASRRA